MSIVTCNRSQIKGRGNQITKGSKIQGGEWLNSFAINPLIYSFFCWFLVYFLLPLNYLMVWPFDRANQIFQPPTQILKDKWKYSSSCGGNIINITLFCVYKPTSLTKSHTSQHHTLIIFSLSTFSQVKFDGIELHDIFIMD